MSESLDTETWKHEGFSSKESQDQFHKWYFRVFGGRYYWELDNNKKTTNIAIWEAGRESVIN
jgi:hypothetical protein